MHRFTPENVITALYRAALGRDPDPEGFASYCNRLVADPQALATIARGLFESAEHRRCLDQMPTILDHSQYGEFRLLLGLLVDAGRRHGIVVDVGARGRDRSNSYDLLTNFGWKGLLIEANPALQDTIRREFADTDFTLLSHAIGVEEGTMPFFIGVNDDVSSLLADHTAGWGAIRSEVSVEVKRLAPVLEQNGVPHDFDLLSLDIEGMDVPVLNDLIDKSEYRPSIVIIEASYNFRTTALSAVGASQLVQHHYAIAERTEANLILRYRP